MDDHCLTHLTHLLKDVEDDHWKKRIINSVRGIEILFDLELETEEVWRDKIQPDSLWVAATDELDVPHAIESLKIYGENPPPTTAVWHDGSCYLVMGSVRALMYCLTNQLIDSIVVDVSRATKIAYPVREARVTLEDYCRHKARCRFD